MTQKVKDKLLSILVYGAGLISILLLGSIIFYLITNGLKLINLDLIKNDYNPKVYNTSIEIKENNFEFTDKDVEGYYSKKWGIAFKDNDKDQTIDVSYVDSDSPFMHMTSLIAGQEGQQESIKVNQSIKNIYYYNQAGEKVFLSSGKMQNAQNLVSILDNEASGLSSISYESKGGGIRGSIIATLYLIAISILISLPIGVMSAIYLREYASNNKFNTLIRQGIDTLTGVPSIVYGLMGVSVLFPITQAFGATSTSILLGALTLAIILLPTIIRSCEEALIAVPQSLRDGSLSLGATKSQTVFKVVLPCAIDGILTGVLLSIGRVIGESAALVYTTSIVINDNPNILSQGTSLSLMIYSIMSSEQPNYELACAISLIILIIVFMINIIVKIIAKKFKRAF